MDKIVLKTIILTSVFVICMTGTAQAGIYEDITFDFEPLSNQVGEGATTILLGMFGLGTAGIKLQKFS